MKTRKFALCLAAVFLVAIYINIQRSHTFTLSDDEGTIKTEQIFKLKNRPGLEKKSLGLFACLAQRKGRNHAI